jgi:hypothetical protein
MKKLFIGLIFVLSFQPSLSNADILDQNVLLFQKMGCLGTCPWFDLMLFESGEQIFIGELYTKIQGVVIERNSRSKYIKIKELLNKYQFSKFPGEFECKEYWTDHPSVSITLQENNKLKRVHHYHGCKGFEWEDEIFKLESDFEKLLNLSRFVESSSAQISRDDLLCEISDQNVFIYRNAGSYRVILFGTGEKVIIMEDANNPTSALGISIEKNQNEKYKNINRLLLKYRFSEFKKYYSLIYKENCKETITKDTHLLFSKTLTLQENKKIKKVYHESWCKGFEREDELFKLEFEIESLLDLNKFGKND